MTNGAISSTMLLWLNYGIAGHPSESTIPEGILRDTILEWPHASRACGERVNIERSAYIGCGNNIHEGDYSEIGRNAWSGRGTTISSHVGMESHAMDFSRKHEHSLLDLTIDLQGQTENAPVRVCDDVWIGARAILLSSITIGSGSIVAARNRCHERCASWGNCRRRPGARNALPED